MFKKKPKRTVLDEIQDITVQIFRSVGKANGIEQIDKLSNDIIMRVSQEAMTVFREVADTKGEKIAGGGHLLTIGMKFIVVYATMGEEFYKEHLSYEINKYKNEGLREDYKRNLID